MSADAGTLVCNKMLYRTMALDPDKDPVCVASDQR